MRFENKSDTIETFGVQFPKKLFLSIASGGSNNLRRFAEKIDRDETVLFAPSWAPIGIRSQQVINEIINSNYRDDLQQLFLYAKSIELLVLAVASFDRYQHPAGDGAVKKVVQTKKDQEKLIAARDLLNGRLTDPPTLPELAKLVTLNEYKLKTGFKTLFGATVFDYVNDQRLSLAFQLLKNGSMTAAEVAYHMGYATPQYFNNAFRKKFGRTPNMVRKNP